MSMIKQVAALQVCTKHSAQLHHAATVARKVLGWEGLAEVEKVYHFGYLLPDSKGPGFGWRTPGVPGDFVWQLCNDGSSLAAHSARGYGLIVEADNWKVQVPEGHYVAVFVTNKGHVFWDTDELYSEYYWADARSGLSGTELACSRIERLDHAYNRRHFHIEF